MIRERCIRLVVLLLAVSAARAGVVIDMETRELDGSAAAAVDRLYAQGEMLRVETGDRGGPTVIFRDQALTIVNDAQRTFSRLNEAQVKELGNRLTALNSQLQTKLADLPPEQRLMMEKMMQDKMPSGAPPAETKVEKGGHEEVDGRDCQKYSVFQDGKLAAEVYTTDIPEVGEGMAALHAMADFSTRVLSSFQGTPLAELSNHPLRIMEEVEGFPVLTREYEGGKAVREVRLKSAEKKDLEANLFAPPEGYEEKEIPGL